MSPSRPSNSTATAHVGTAPDADTLVEAYAEDLMDDIFEDVDRILAGDDSAVYAETTEQVVTEQMVASSPLFRTEAVTVPAMIVPLTAGQAVEAPATEPETTPQTDEQQAAPNQPAQKRPWRNLLLGAAGLSLLVACGFWWMRQQPTPQTGTAPTNTAPTVSEETAFGEYLQRSLQVIRGERSAQADAQGPGNVATAPPAAPAANQPTGQPGVIERVFVPLLQPGTATSPRTATAPNPAPNTAATLPAPNVSTTQPRSTNDSGTSGTVPNIATAGSYELVGVLELGDRSAALFEVDGTSQRVYIGEIIGASGWSIVSIGDEEVVVRRNGEVRSIYIGQQF
ncbi:hypothetical protein IQ260_09660 [Leptolyngbya cf. ectocarpi LEGE 11479]|uniref:Type II secretion system protein GspC N-terminal domain-containing protein n=1 Tax=Leptolyngbya cf. ectocarpi LEGE 11479 TaxID=1828722 RepID=A0A928X302_LEPEC|nr:hypothetical protein [Leptolyngbya ectocarpi]MBE9066920.1 hypothetical protein [Leptolyngbya cf. ectocarpi LEGE 11479]